LSINYFVLYRNTAGIPALPAVIRVSPSCMAFQAGPERAGQESREFYNNQ
jgi:hypothetical protein